MSHSHHWYYSKEEERANTLTHFVGMLLAIVGLILLILRAANTGYINNIVGCSVYGVSLVILYTASFLYHYSEKIGFKRTFQFLDHLSIYFLIAGTYTPVALIALYGTISWIILGLLWGLAIFGFFYKLFFFDSGWISTFIYILMGWTALGFIVQVVEALPLGCLMLILLGGVIYTSGTLFYMLDEHIKYCHALWHVFVLGGTICHFFAIYIYLAGSM